MSYASYIKNATPGAFSGQPSSSNFRQPPTIASKAVEVNGQGDQERTGGEVFDLDANVTIADSQFFDRDAEKHMRELLSGAIGEGEDDEAEEAVEINGLAEGVTLMPHQIRGVRWLKKREAARNFGGILADVSDRSVLGASDLLTIQDMGLGKTVQMIARICERKANAVEQKSGYAGTL
jgi:SNF2 family DNA or RNA helicase